MKLVQQLNLPLILPEPDLANDFIESTSNWEAVTWIKRWPDWPIRQVVIYGEPGCGKSHLGQMLMKNGNTILITPELMQQTAPDIIAQQATTFIVDDYDKIEDETWLFHFYNIAQEHKNYVLYLGEQPPGQIDFKLPDLSSRLRSLLTFAIAPPCDELQQQLLKLLLKQRGVSASEEVVDYLLRRIERSYVAILEIVKKIDTLTLSLQRPLTVPLVRELLIETPET